MKVMKTYETTTKIEVTMDITKKLWLLSSANTIEEAKNVGPQTRSLYVSRKCNTAMTTRKPISNAGRPLLWRT